MSIEDLKQADEGSYRCRVDFKQAPSRIHKLYLQIVGKSLWAEIGWKTQSDAGMPFTPPHLHILVPPSQVEILTQSGNSLEDERYNEETDLKLTCLVRGGNVLSLLAK